MPSNLTNPNNSETIFVHRDYDQIVAKTMQFVSQKRDAIKDKLTYYEIADSQDVEFFDMSRYIKKLEKNQNIYFTDESEDIIAFLGEQPREVAKQVYGKIGEAICDEYLNNPSGDFEETMSDIALGMTEIELITRDGVMAGIRIGGEYEEDDDEFVDEKIETKAEKNQNSTNNMPN